MGTALATRASLRGTCSNQEVSNAASLGLKEIKRFNLYFIQLRKESHT